MDLISILQLKFSGQLKLDIQTYLQKAPSKYKIYTIPKRKGGTRVIAQPAKQTKILQKFVIDELYSNFPIHNAAMAYRKKHNIKMNASVHVGQKYLLSMDFENFFHSITPALFWEVYERLIKQPISPIEKRNFQNLFFWRPKKQSEKLLLSIGAPSSPFISNFIMYEFDCFIYNYCETIGVRYTRYADDLSFSTNQKDILFQLPKVVSVTLNELYKNRININLNKTSFSSKAHNRHVTGITLTNEDKLSIGRSTKRYIKHLVHKLTLDELSIEDKNYLSGYLNYVNFVEPDFITSLERKYSKEVILMARKKHE
jgi:retron-type reverse transcriptase